MPHYFFPEFTEEGRVLPRMERYWEALWNRVTCDAPRSREWASPWMKNALQNGNPIFTAVCPALHRGARIIQEEVPAADETDFDCWIDYFGDMSDPAAIRELVIACCPSRENERRIESILRRWVREGCLTIESPIAEGWIASSDAWGRQPICG